MKPYYQDDYVTIYNADCLEVLPELPKVDLVLTDPPYPDWMAKEYFYNEGTIMEALKYSDRFMCFWSSKVEFIHSFDRVHIWDKKTGTGSEYERIFEKGCGDKNWKVFSHYFINSEVAASFTGDVFNEHKAQKPIKLIKQLLTRSNTEGLILDPFAGSCTTGRAAKDLGRKCICIELEEKYCEIGAKRMCQEVMNFN